MKSIDEIVSMEKTQKYGYFPVNFNSLNTYMHITKPDEITKESLENFFGDNLYYPNNDNVYLTHILASWAFRQGLTLEKTIKLYKIIYEMLDPNLPGGSYGEASITTCFIETTTYMLTRNGLEFGIDFLKFIYRMNIQNGFDINYTDARNLNFISYVKLVDKYLNLIYKENKISPKFSYLNCIKENLNSQEIIFNFQNFYNDYHVDRLSYDDLINIFETNDFDYQKRFAYVCNKTIMKEESQLCILNLKKIKKEMENE